MAISGAGYRSALSQWRRRHWSYRPAEVRVALFCLSITFVGLLFFNVIPVLASIYLGFTDFNPLRDSRPYWTGLDNYVRLLDDSHFNKAIGNTLYYYVFATPLTLGLGLIAALAFNRQIRGMAFFRITYYVPTLASMVAVSLFWLWIFNPDYGLLNAFIGVFGFEPVRWLLTPESAMPSIIILSVWRGAGFAMIIFLAGLQTIPQHLYESSEIDGANRWQRFIHVTWPLLRPTTAFLFITFTLGAFQVFEQVFVLTRGGPAEATTTIVHQIYARAFSYLMMGYASAQATLLLLALLVITIINMRLLARDIEY